MPPKLPKFRVLSPNAAKARSSIPHQPHLQPTPSSQSPPRPHPTTKKSPPRSFTSSLGARYASLPPPARRTLRTLCLLAPILPITIFLSEHTIQPVWVRGPSMTPYLNEDYEVMHTERDLVLVRMWAAGGFGGVERKRRIERGMVVTLRSPANPTNIAIKRIIGLPGDRVYTREPCMKESQIVPFNHVWVEGDAVDPRNTMDSNTYGPVSVSLITGRVVAVLRPRFRWLDWENWERGVVEGDSEGRFGGRYREEVRRRVVKEAVQLERPFLT
ncbi:peptidase S24/S26A/S26B/S26C [Aspergillus cavernicola]|uniref:Mitochondrial inner membrane protease subunit 2 n=1 Tax=Aspergillus cavernicola TaxID=176166 RepID=A0ABR4J5Q5_9EURO